MMTLFVGSFFSCGQGGNSQIDEQAVKDSIAQVEVMKAKQDSIEKVESSVTLITDFYQYVFGEKEWTNSVLKKYLDESLMKSFM